ncbi:MAG: hypothetical protein ACE5NG_00275 [bacterium]
MRNFLGQIVMSIILAILCLAQGLYGNVPVESDSLSRFVNINPGSPQRIDIEILLKNQMRSLFIRPEGENSGLLLMLVFHNDEVTKEVQEILNSDQTPLIFSVSTLPFSEVYFEPSFFQFEQDGQVWQPGTHPGSHDIIALGENSKFGGLLHDDEIHQGVILLPEWIDINRPFTIRYAHYKKYLTFK